MRASLPLLLLLVVCPLAHATDPVADLEIHMQIRDHRKLGEFERALELARDLLDSARADSTARDYELVNRGVLVETLEEIVALPPTARSEIQEAERLVDDYRQSMSDARFREGLRIAERLLAIRRRHFGSRHHDVATSLYLCAVAHEAIGEYAAAEPLFLSARRFRRRQHIRE